MERVVKFIDGFEKDGFVFEKVFGKFQKVGEETTEPAEPEQGIEGLTYLEEEIDESDGGGEV